MIAPTAPASLEVHHGVPRCLLRLRDRTEVAGLTGEGALDSRLNAAVYVARHHRGDWGEVPHEDARETGAVSATVGAS